MSTQTQYKAIKQKIELEGARAYNMSVTIVNNSGQVIREDGLFAFMFTNIGDTAGTVNGMVVFPNADPTTGLGDSRSISGHLLDLYKGFINVSFPNPPNADPAIEIVQLFYSENAQIK